MSCCNGKSQILAVIFDLDGTLLHTETKGVLKEFLERYGIGLDKEREEKKRFGMTLKESAIAIVKDYDLPLTPEQFIQEIIPIYQQRWLQAKALPGATRLINHLHKHGVPFALASNSLREYIDTKISYQPGWAECFTVILGSDQVKCGKPAPDLFLEAARIMGVAPDNCLVIEDSLVGVKAAKAAEMKIVAVPPHREADASSMADTVLNSLLEFQPEQWGLSPFEDWVDNALPVEPIYVSGSYFDGCLHEITDGESTLPDQVSGIYFGWAKVDMQRILKVVVSLGWDPCLSTAARKIQICPADENANNIAEQQIHLLLVGYIRGLNSKGTESAYLEVVDEDKSIASVSLDLPTLVHSSCKPFFAVAVADADASSLE